MSRLPLLVRIGAFGTLLCAFSLGGARFAHAQASSATGATAVPAQRGVPELALFEIPPFHSQISFSVPFMGLATVKGGFEDFNGALLLNQRAPTSSSLTVVI